MWTKTKVAVKINSSAIVSNITSTRSSSSTMPGSWFDLRIAGPESPYAWQSTALALNVASLMAEPPAASPTESVCLAYNRGWQQYWEGNRVTLACHTATGLDWSSHGQMPATTLACFTNLLSNKITPFNAAQGVQYFQASALSYTMECDSGT